MSSNSPSIFSGKFPQITAMLCDALAARSAGGRAPWFSPDDPQILLPSRGTANGIARGLLERFPAGIAGIAFQTPEALARSVLNASGSFPHVASDLERSLAFRVACRRTDHELTRGLGAEALMERSYRDIRDSGMSIDEFETRTLRRGTPLAQPLTVFLQVARLYEEYLGAIAAIDPADLLNNAAGVIERGARIASQLVFGFYDLTGVQQKLILALRKAGRINSIYIPVPLEGGLADTTYEFASPFVSLMTAGATAIESAGKAVPPEIRSQSFATPHEELRETCRSVRRLLDAGIQATDVAITIRSIEPRDAARLRRYAAEFGIPLRSRTKKPLRSQRIGRSILNLFRVRDEGFPRNRVFQLLRDGLRAGSESERGIDALDWLTRRHHIAGGSREILDRTLEGLALREPESARMLDAYRGVVTDLEQLTAPWTEPLGGAEWRKVLAGLLQRFQLETEEDLAAAEAVEAIGELLAGEQKIAEPFDAGIVAGALESTDVAQRPISSAGQVWFGDVMSLRGRAFDHLFVVAAQEDRFPQGRTPDPLLPDRLRETAGMRAIGDGRSEEDLLFQLTIDAARKSITISRARSDGFGKLLRPSVFLQRFAVADTGQSENLLPLSEWEQRTQAMAHPSTLHSPALRRRLSLALGSGTGSAYDGIVEIDSALAGAIRERLAATSPTYFEDFGECPQRFLFRRLLRADEIEDPEHEPQLNRRDKGTLDHAILEAFYRRLPPSAYDEAASRHSLSPSTRDLLHQSIDEEFDRLDREFPPYNATMRRIDRAMTRTALERFVASDLMDLAELKLRPAWFEYSFGTDRHGPPEHPDPVVLELGGERIGFRGTIDRIDSTFGADPRFTNYRVVDYKSGRANSYKSLRKKIDSGHKLQLALYAVALEQIFAVDPEQISGIIKPFVPNGGVEQFGFRLSETKERLLDNLSEFVLAIMAGKFPAYPDDDGSCRYCPLNHSCRTRHDTGERRALRRTESVRELITETLS